MTLIQKEPKKIYIRVEAQPITTAGIYHNSDLGLISLSSDGSNWITIADKNLGATSTDISSIASYGYNYQWGNNYGFANSGTVTTSSNQVNAQNYGPGNYYSSSTFIVRTSSPYRWDSSNNNNLWGGVTGTVEAMQGPCSNDFHIPTDTERSSILTIWAALGGQSNPASNFLSALKLPLAGYRGDGSGVIGQGTYGYYWCANALDNDWKWMLEIDAYSNPNVIRMTQRRSIIGQSIRPFANTPTQPTDDRTVLYPSS